MPSSLTEALDNLYTTTWQNMKSETQDQIYDATPFWFWMKQKGRIKDEEGGRFITEPLRFAKSDNVKFITRGGTVSLADKEFLTVAVYEWRYLVDSIVRFGVDDQKNRGKNQIISLMKAKLENSKDSLTDKLEKSLFGKASDEGGIGFHGLQDVVPDDPTAAVVFGGINPSAGNDTWWRSQSKNMTGLSLATNLRKEMTKMVHACMNNLRQDRTDIIVCGQTPYEAYEDLTIPQKQIVNKTLGDAGFENLEFKGIPMIWSPSCANTRLYTLTSKHLTFKRDPMMNFDMTEWKAIPDQVNDRAAQIILGGNLVTGRRRVHGVLHTMDTP